VSVELFVGLLGLVGAFVSALVGIGGAIVMLPLLLYVPPLVGLPPFDVKAATGLASAQVLFATVLGTFLHHRRGSVDRRLVLWVAPAMTAASLVAAIVSSALPPQALLATFAVVATLAGGAMLLPARHLVEEHPRVGVFNRPLACLIGVVSGTLVGLVGSGTFVLAPAFLHLLRVPTRITIGSTLGVAVFAALAATLGKTATGQVPLGPALAVLVGTVPGVYVGAHVSGRLSPALLRALLAVLITVVALRAWWDLLR